MAWQIKDEFIDLAQAKHTVIYHNPDVLVDYGRGKMEPQEHHLIHDFSLNACPLCGAPQSVSVGESVGAQEPLDFEKKKTETLAALHAHHQLVRKKLELHPRVRLGRAPKP